MTKFEIRMQVDTDLCAAELTIAIEKDIAKDVRSFNLINVRKWTWESETSFV